MYKRIVAMLYLVAVVAGGGATPIPCERQCELPCESPCEQTLRASGPLPQALVTQACASWPPSPAFCKKLVIGASFHDAQVNLAKVPGCSSVRVSQDARFYLVYGL
jgi:hypothetical protein